MACSILFLFSLCAILIAVHSLPIENAKAIDKTDRVLSKLSETLIPPKRMLGVDMVTTEGAKRIKRQVIEDDKCPTGMKRFGLKCEYDNKIKDYYDDEYEES